MTLQTGRSNRFLLPLFLRVEGKSVVVVGGGAVASGKVQGLVLAGARVTVVAPVVRQEIRATRVSVIERVFRPGDLDEAWLAVAAGPREVNREVAAAAEERRVFVNAVDDPDNGNAYTGGVLRRGGVTIAVATEGRAPALAGLLREALESIVPEEIEVWVETAAALRREQRETGVAVGERRPLLLRALNRLYEAKGVQVSQP